MKEGGTWWNGFRGNKGKKNDVSQSRKGFEGLHPVSREDVPAPLLGTALGRQ